MLKPGDSDKEFIEAVGNPSRLRILITLWKSNEELRIYRICRLTGLGRSSVRRHLDKLVKNGLVSRKVYGEIILYTVNRENPRLDALSEFFRKARL